MFASLSRGSAKSTRSYICSSCLCNILTAPILPPLLLDRASVARHALFSTTSAVAYPKDGEKSAETGQSHSSKSSKKRRSNPRTQRRLRRRPENKLIPNSNITLETLRESLKGLEEEQTLLSEALSPGPSEGNSTQDPKESERTPPKTKKGKGHSASDVATKEPHSKSPKTSKLKKKAGSESTTKKAEKAAQDASKKAADGAVKETGSLKIKKVFPILPRDLANPVEKPQKPWESAQKSWERSKLTPRLQMRLLVKDLQEGSLPENERRYILQTLRHSLLTMDAAPKSPRKEKLQGNNPRDQSLKDAMLRPRKPYLKQPFGIEIPYKVGRPRASNGPPVDREPPGPIRKDIGPKFLRGLMTAHEIETVKADGLELTPVDSGLLDVPSLAYGLERVLFNPGVYQLQDPRTRVFNFDPYLQTIMPVSEFDFNALKQYVTSSKDDNLLSTAAAVKKKYTGSTSSMTSTLSQFHFLLSQWRLINVGNLSKMFPVQYHTFTGFQRAPVSIFLRWKDGTYAIDADKQFDGASILSMLGKSMEKLLTLPTADFEKYRKGKSDQISDEERNEPESFHYTTMGDFLMRSQLDAYDSRLPGTGMFDLKTRAVISIRMDTDAYEEGSGYQIRNRHGEWESFEREYYDMIRSAFLKYSLQVRMGRMDGIFVAFHNTEHIFGFQYISLEEMDYAIHGTDDKRLGDAEFKISVDLLNRVIDRATAKYPEKSLRIHFETRDAVTPFMYIFAEPIEEEKIEKIQATNRSQIEEFERQVLGLDVEEINERKKKAQWDEIRARVEETMTQDEHDPERKVENVDDDDIDAMTEEERHQITALVSSHSLDEDVHDEEDEESDSIVDVEAVELDEETEEPVDTDVVETDEMVDEDIEEAALSAESRHDMEEAEEIEGASEGAEIENEADNEIGEEITPVKESEEIQEDLGTTGSSDIKTIDEDNFVDEDASEDTDTPSTSKSLPTKRRELLAMTLTIRNKVDGIYVAQPDDDNYPPGAKWEVEYALAEVQDSNRASLLYKACKTRRRNIHNSSLDLTSNDFQDNFVRQIGELSKAGREWREKQKKLEESLPIKILDEKLETSSITVDKGNDVEE